VPVKQTLRIGSRGSKLALWQSNHIKEQLESLHEGLEVEITIIKTKGDIIQDVALSKIGDKGLFTKELEVALLNEDVDLCVHSMKDMPTEIPEGLMLGPVPPRVCPLDALVAPEGISSLDELPKGARIGTGSLRRRAQLYALEKGFELVEQRGNLDTRMKRVENGELDAAILAAAGIHRLGWKSRIAALIDPEVMTPAVGQGALALEMRIGDENTFDLCRPLGDDDTERCVEAERYIMRTLEGGCQIPIGAYAQLENGQLTTQAMVAAIDGSRVIRATHQTPEMVVEDLLSQGATEILASIR